MSDFTHSSLTTVFKDDDIHFEIEELVRGPGDGRSGETSTASTDVMLLVHVRLRRWTPDILRACLRHWKNYRSSERRPVFASPQDADPKGVALWRHFATIFGFVPLLEDAPCNDGQRRPIYIHRVDNESAPNH